MTRTIIVIIIAALAGAVIFVTNDSQSNSRSALARQRADAYMQGINDCDFEKFVQAKNDIAEAADSAAESRRNFEQGCGELESFSHIKTARQTDQESTSKELQRLGGQAEVYSVDYKVESSQNKDTYVTRLLVGVTDTSWSVSAAPSFPMSYSDYLNLKNGN